MTKGSPYMRGVALSSSHCACSSLPPHIYLTYLKSLPVYRGEGYHLGNLVMTSLGDGINFDACTRRGELLIRLYTCVTSSRASTPPVTTTLPPPHPLRLRTQLRWGKPFLVPLIEITFRSHHLSMKKPILHWDFSRGV